MSKFVDNIQSKWEKLNPRERLICGVTAMMVAILLSKLIVFDPYQKSKKSIEESKIAQMAELETVKTEKTKLLLEVKSHGQETTDNELEKLKAKDAELNSKIGQVKSTVISGAQAFALMDILTKTAGVGLKEISLPTGKVGEGSDGDGNKKIAMVYEHKIKVVMVGDWDNYKVLLKKARESSGALHLQSVLFNRDEKGGSQMTAVFSALSLDESWQLPLLKR